MWRDELLRSGHMRSLSPLRSPLLRKRCPEFGFSYLSASLTDLSVTHEHPLHHGHDDADFDISAPFPCPVQTGVCPQSRPTPDLQTPVVRDTQNAVPRLSLLRSFRPVLCTQISLSLRGKKRGKRPPPPFIMSKQLRDPSMDSQYQCYC